MRIFKTSVFARWADKENLSDGALVTAVNEMEQGLIDASLGGQVYKKRVPIEGRGKSGGLRTLLAFRKGQRSFFIYGFAKNQQANIGPAELKALKLLAKELIGSGDDSVKAAVDGKALIEVENDG